MNTFCVTALGCGLRFWHRHEGKPRPWRACSRSRCARGLHPQSGDLRLTRLCHTATLFCIPERQHGLMLPRIPGLRAAIDSGTRISRKTKRQQARNFAYQPRGQAVQLRRHAHRDACSCRCAALAGFPAGHAVCSVSRDAHKIRFREHLRHSLFEGGGAVGNRAARRLLLRASLAASGVVMRIAAGSCTSSSSTGGMRRAREAAGTGGDRPLLP